MPQIVRQQDKYSLRVDGNAFIVLGAQTKPRVPYSPYNGLANESFSPPSLVFKYLQSDM